MPDRSEHVPVIAVASGKGGVGKTTVAVNLALALTAQGRRTGLIDADLYGPDVPRMMGLRRRAEASSVTLFARQGAADSRLQTVSQHGVQLASAAFLLGENQALAVGGSIAQLLVRRLVSDSEWDDLDYLVMDLPPGTADIQQFVFALSGRPMCVLVVVTPQVVARQDARRSRSPPTSSLPSRSASGSRIHEARAPKGWAQAERTGRRGPRRARRTRARARPRLPARRARARVRTARWSAWRRPGSGPAATSRPRTRR
jgi:hypothetical protein